MNSEPSAQGQLTDTDTDTDTDTEYLIDDCLSEEPEIASETTKSRLVTQISLEMLTLSNQVKIFHWQTKGYAEHKALDKLFEILTDQTDRWVETAMGKYQRIHLSKRSSLSLENIPDSGLTRPDHTGLTRPDNTGLTRHLKEWVKRMRCLRDQHFRTSQDSDLSNIFDEVFGSVNRTCYLLSLR